MRGKIDLIYPRRLKSIKGLRAENLGAVYGQCQNNRSLCVLVKQDNLIT